MSFGDLPDEILVRIFEELPLQDLVSVTTVCKPWNYLANDDVLWKPICENTWKDFDYIFFFYLFCRSDP